MAILFFIYINSKFKLLLDYLNEKQVTNSKIPDIYLPYMKAYYYYNSFKCAKTIFFFSLILIICFFSLNISNIFLKKQYLCLLALISEKISLFCLIEIGRMLHLEKLEILDQHQQFLQERTGKSDLFLV